MTPDKIKRRDKLALEHYSTFQHKDEEIAKNNNIVIEKRFSSFCYGYDAGYEDSEINKAVCCMEMEEQNKELTRKLEIAKAALKEYASQWDKEQVPTKENILSDYDCGCCSFGAAGSRAFAALKELE